MKKIIYLFIYLFAGTTNAAIITNSSSSSSFDQLIDFESIILARNEVVTSQFASEGLNIVSHSGSVYANSCGSNTSGTGSYINTYGTGCSTNRSFQDFSLVFDTDVTSLTWLVGYSSGSINYQTYLGGNIVESLNNASLSFTSYITFTGMFDEIRITETRNSAYTMIDNLQISYAQAQVPEPASLALVSLGLVSFGFSRKKKKA